MCAEGGADVSADEPHAFTDALAQLKESGSNLLLVGNVGRSVLLQVCQRFLGDPVSASRRRLFVCTDSDGAIAGNRMENLYASAGSNATKVIKQETKTRSAAASARTFDIPIPYVNIEDESLVALAGEIEDAIETFDAENDGLDPAEFRMCFNSLAPVIANHDEEDAFRFLHVVTAMVRDARGMAHYHLPLHRTDDTVELVAPLFDGVVEVRVTEGCPEQRWHLHGQRNVSTEWLAV